MHSRWKEEGGQKKDLYNKRISVFNHISKLVRELRPLRHSYPLPNSKALHSYSVKFRKYGEA